MKYFSIIVLFFFSVIMPAQGQVFDHAPAVAGPSGAAVETRAEKMRSRPRFCRGSIRDSIWYLSTSEPVTWAVIDVNNRGRVKPQGKDAYMASSRIFGLKKIRGGKLYDNDPSYPGASRCYASGTIKVAGRHIIELFNGFIGHRMISGNCKIDGIHETLCTLVKMSD